MEALKLGEIRVHLKGGTSYISPELNKANIVRSLKGAVARIEHYKPIVLQTAPPQTPKATGKTKDSLLKGNTSATDVIKFIEDSDSVEDIGIVIKGDTRKTVKAAAKKRLGELI